jgi:serine protease AprX
MKDVRVCREYVQAVLSTGARWRATSRWLDAIGVEATAAQAAAIRSFPFVREVRPLARGVRKAGGGEAPIPDSRRSPAGRLDYGESACQVAPLHVPELHARGLSGAGVLVCILDTGFRRIHTCLQHVDVVAEWDFIQGDPVTDNQPGDQDGQMRHGTEMLSLIAGLEPGHLIGPAWGASYALAKTEEVWEEDPADEDRWVQGIEWADSLGADIVTSSLCYWDWYTYDQMDGNTAATTIAGDQAVANGILVLNAMGNAGASAWHYLMAAADGDSVLGIGAVDTFGVVCAFSSRGPSSDGRTKPDFVAVGDGNVVAKVWGVTGYNRESGTSCSTPLVAGVCALILEAHPEWTPTQVAEALRSTATHADYPDTLYGWGVPLGDAAADYAMTAAIDSPRPERLRAPQILCRPNPFSESAEISFASPSSPCVPVLVDIFDARGRRILSRPGMGAFLWDGSDALGREVPPGVYFLRAETAGGIAAGRLVRVR